MEQQTSVQQVREQNPAFSKLLDVLNSRHTEDGTPKTIDNQLKQVESRLSAVKQLYLEQHLFRSELMEVLQRTSSHSGVTSSPHNNIHHLLAAAEVQHCLDVHPDTTLLGLTPEHLRAAVDPAQRFVQKSKQEIHRNIEQHLKEKCLRVVKWHTPHKQLSADESLQLAKVGQLPQVVLQQKAEIERTREELQMKEREMCERLCTKHKILCEMCEDLKHALEQYKLVLTAQANEVTLSYLQTQCQAMLGKLDVMHHQLLKGICSDGRLEAHREIRSHLHSARVELEEHLSQTQQTLHNYQCLGEEFSSLARQYREILDDVENKQWALEELNKTK